MEILKTPPQVIPYMQTIPGQYAKYLSRTSGNYYGAIGVSGNTGAFAVAADKIYARPFLVMQTESFDRIGLHISTGTTGKARLGIYADDGTLQPGARILDAGSEIDTADSGFKEITINQSLTPGLYWLVCIFNATPSVRKANSVIAVLGLGASSATYSSGASEGYYTTQAYGELPIMHPAPTLGNVESYPCVLLRRV